MKTEWEDTFMVLSCADCSELSTRKRVQVQVTHVFDGCETTKCVDFDEYHLEEFLSVNDAKLVHENVTTVDLEEYARMKDLARLYADQTERANREAARANYAEFLLGLALEEGLKAARKGGGMSTPYIDDLERAKLEGYTACEKAYREREVACEEERAELVASLRATQDKLSELRRSASAEAMRRGNLVKQCIDGGHDLEITESIYDSGVYGYKVRVDHATRTVLKSGIFDAIEEMLKEVSRG